MIMDYIPTGKDNAVSMKDLAIAMRTDARTVRKMIHSARMDGAIICGTNAGYYKPETDDELLSYYRLARRRALSGLASLKAARAVLKERGIRLNEGARK